MATPPEKLADSLDALRQLQNRGVVAIRAVDLSRVNRERLLNNGFIQEVMKGWYIPARPDETAGESTTWYASFWAFCAAYLRERFGTEWSLSPEQSLSLHAGNYAVPRQLLVRSPKARNRATALPHGTSVFDMRAALPSEKDVEEREGLRLFSLPAALIASASGFFASNSTDARAVLATVRDGSEVLNRLLEGGHSTIAGRLAGAFRNVGRDRIADDILKTMRSAGYAVREQDPFASRIDLVFPRREASPYAARIRLMWQQMRDTAIERFPAPVGQPNDIEAYMKRVQEAYVADAYHSLSIEGYRVSPELIERVRSGTWNPDNNEQDREHRNALAARGYWLAYQAVQKSLYRVLRGENPGVVADEDHGTWYREMFSPSVTAGLLRPADLAGYRNGPVHIRRSMHIPPNSEAVRDAMPVFFEILAEETEPSVRVVLGHFVFVYIHPYTDGNGRTGRFLMNVMLAAAGYPWTVIPVQRRNEYMAALEEASVRQDIAPFVDFLSQLVEEGARGRSVVEAATTGLPPGP
ncbi:Fic family protein [Shumkonia mesophila]|uniref:Fic family protein n=1 Tax=Shumkonia mesophila TaxID=2838854 RepID=UPI002934E54A|nr:Fic family protein [Shumkonia mesophila]